VSEHPLQAGSAQVVITPPLGISMAGYYHDRRANDIRDDLHAKALVLSLNATTVALVVCDLIGLERALASRARQQITERTGIPASHVLICCTHTHTGPVLADRPLAGMVTDQAYVEVLTAKIADAVQLAYQRRQAVSLYVGSGHVEGIAFNRRYWMQDGTLRTNPPFQSPDIVRPAGPVDPELGILFAQDRQSNPLAMVNTYALHADEVGGTAICADYQGVESRLLQHVLGDAPVVLCPNGTCGDINHFDVSRPADRQKGYVAAERSGRALAGEAIKQLTDLKPARPEYLRAGCRMLQVDLRLPSPDEVAWAEKVARDELHGFDRQGLDVVRAHRILRMQAMGASQLAVEISAIALGEVAFVGFPGEVFVELGLSVKRASPFPYTFPVELCNDAVGYIPTRAAYDEGGYEATSSPFPPGTGERMVETALELLHELAVGDG
jgi:neutral ceramidase